MTALVWHLRRAARWLGAAGLAGLALGAAALFLYLADTLPRQDRIAEQHIRFEALRAAALRDAATPTDGTPVPATAALPPTGEAASQIGELERLARARGIALPRGQYSAGTQAGLTLVRWQIALPVEASYPALQAWLADALDHLPNLALDELKLKRERIESRTLQAELRFSLYVETAP